MEIKKQAGQRLQQSRLAKGLRLQDITDEFPEYSISRLSNWENGRNMIGVEDAKKIGPFLGVRAAYLLTLEDELDQTMATLLTYYRQSDDRGRMHILTVAESESKFIVPGQGDAGDSATQ